MFFPLVPTRRVGMQLRRAAPSPVGWAQNPVPTLGKIPGCPITDAMRRPARPGSSRWFPSGGGLFFALPPCGGRYAPRL